MWQLLHIFIGRWKNIFRQNFRNNSTKCVDTFRIRRRLFVPIGQVTWKWLSCWQKIRRIELRHQTLKTVWNSKMFKIRVQWKNDHRNRPSKSTERTKYERNFKTIDRLTSLWTKQRKRIEWANQCFLCSHLLNVRLQLFVNFQRNLERFLQRSKESKRNEKEMIFFDDEKNQFTRSLKFLCSTLAAISVNAVWKVKLKTSAGGKAKFEKDRVDHRLIFVLTHCVCSWTTQLHNIEPKVISCKTPGWVR